MTIGLRLGAPGVYPIAPGGDDASPRPVALDDAGFAGVAPRGPVDVAVAVRSWPEYLARFGLGPGLLPLAVKAFFAQGGRRAHVLRVGPPPSVEAHALIEQGTYDATGRWIPLRTTGGSAPVVRWLARDEGAWANAVTVTLTTVLGQRFTVEPAASSRPLAPDAGLGNDRMVFPPAGVQAPVGSLLHVRTADGSGGIRWIDARSEREVEPGIRRTAWVLDVPLPPQTVSLGLVLATVTVDDHAPEGPPVESFDVGLSPRHPRWLASVLDTGSQLVAPDAAWADWSAIALTDPLLPPIRSRIARPGTDRYADIGAQDLLGRSPIEPPDDDPAGERPHRGAEQLALAELGLFTVPDLAWNGIVPAKVTEEPPDPPPDGFAPCAPPQPPARLHTPGVEAAYLDSRLPGQLAELQARQQWLSQLADTARRFVVLLDVPQGLSARAVADWRAGFDSSYTATYHPWLGTLPPQPPTTVVPSAARLTPPSAFAAGIIAAREITVGLPTGPANEIAAGAVTIADRVTDTEHAALHPLGINVFRAERDGFRLTAARTLSRDPDYQQMTVRRLITMLRLTLDRESQWVVFEPHTAALRAVLVLHISALLRGQFRAGAFAGATEAQSYFVRADTDLNPPESIALGRTVLEVGVAPSSPLEFILLKVTRDGDTVNVREVAGG
ncbi:phage tail sheath subtilisin-like domain-containing protein [Streptomyces sp. NPDC020766]|uniref:phage tail sheath subtilisin-like domain-containing protein n=1 Tax=Streptomyces sp. NPDC020766 TaxID=3155011 RepID=UPI0033EA0D46